jgi:hypothetical protein
MLTNALAFTNPQYALSNFARVVGVVFQLPAADVLTADRRLPMMLAKCDRSKWKQIRNENYVCKDAPKLVKRIRA